MTPAERQQTAYDLHQTGKSWQEIGWKLGGVTKARAQFLAKRHLYQKKKLQYASSEFGEKLSMRLDRISAVKSLHESGLLNSPKKIVAAGPIELLKIKNIGRKSLLVITSLLQERRFIEDARQWFGYESEQH